MMSAESGWKALVYGVGISEVPLMILVGYVVGRRIGREEEGVALGTVLGLVLFLAYVRWAYRKSKETHASVGKSSEPTTKG